MRAAETPENRGSVSPESPIIPGGCRGRLKRPRMLGSCVARRVPCRPQGFMSVRAAAMAQARDCSQFMLMPHIQNMRHAGAQAVVGTFLN